MNELVVEKIKKVIQSLTKEQIEYFAKKMEDLQIEKN